MKIGRFFVDIRGTITCKSGYDYCKEKERMVELVKKIILKDHLDEIRISLVSSDQIDIVEKYGYDLEKLFENVPKVKLGHHHAEGLQMHIHGKKRKDADSKVLQMVENLLVCDHSHCYYADDCKVNRKIAGLLFERRFSKMKVVMFDPGEEEIHGLNDDIERYIN